MQVGRGVFEGIFEDAFENERVVATHAFSILLMVGDASTHHQSWRNLKSTLICHEPTDEGIASRASGTD
jgi:hypothetical protein